MKASLIQGNFTGGEISPLTYGRAGDLDRYKTSLALSKNYVPLIQGGLTRRPGTVFVEEVKDSTKKTRLFPFKFSAIDAYILEFGAGYIRFFTERGQVLDGNGDPYELTTSFTEDEIFEINITQSADVLYLCHPSYMPLKLSRYASTAWYLQDIPFSFAPFEFNAQIMAFATSSISGQSATVTAGQAVIGIVSSIANNGGKYEVTFGGPVSQAYAQYTRLKFVQTAGTVSFAGDWDVEYIGSNKFILLGSTYAAGYTQPADVATGVIPVFKSSDVGRRIELTNNTDTYFDMVITAYTDSLTVTAQLHWGTAIAAKAALTAKLGLWYQGNGPSAACFFEDRLWFVGTPSALQRIDGSQTGDYENFKPMDEYPWNEISASCAVSFRLNSTDVNAGKWLFADEKGLITGTLASEWVVKSASTQEAISPTSISAKPVSAIGSSDCYPVQAGKAVLFVTKSGRKVTEFHYFYDVDGFRATDLSVLSEHLTKSGIKQLAYQKDPHQIIWAVKENGGLIALTYDRDIDNLRAGWHQHELGGTNEVESVAVIPSPDGKTDDVWLVVKRHIDGDYVRYIEYLSEFFEDEDPQRDAYFLDCGLKHDVPLAIEDIDLSTPVQIEITGHGLSNGDKVIFHDVEGTEELNGNSYTVAGATANTFQISSTVGTDFSPYISGGDVRKKVSTINGLGHLEGEEVSVLGDGAVQESKTVTGGAITLQYPAATVSVGLHANADGQLLRADAGAADGTSIGKTRRTNKVGFMLHRSLNLKIGLNFDDLTDLQMRNTSVPMGQAAPLFSGIIQETLDSDYNFDSQVCWRQDKPLPSTILAIMPNMTTQDG